MLVRSAPFDGRRIAAEGVAEDSQALIAGALDAEEERRSVRVALVEDVAARPTDGVDDEVVDVAATVDAVDGRVRPTGYLTSPRHSSAPASLHPFREESGRRARRGAGERRCRPASAPSAETR